MIVCHAFPPSFESAGACPFGPDVARDLGDLLVRDVEAVVALEGQEEVVARDARDRLRLEAQQPADAVVLVNDVVAGPQVGEALERTPHARVGARRPLAEDLCVREEDEVEVAQDEPAARGRDREHEPRLVRQIVALVEHDRLDAAEEPLRPQRLSAMHERDDDPVPGPDVAEQVALRLGEAARRDGRALRLEGVWLAARELGQPDGRAEVELRAELLPHGLDGLLRLPDEVGRGQGRDEIGRNGVRHAVVRQARLDEVDAPLRRREDHRFAQPVQCSLRERRERPERFDLVAEQLDPHGLPAGRREDVHDPATDGELSAFLGLRHPLVAGQGESFRQRLDAGLVPDPEHDRLRPSLLRRDSLRRSERRGAHEAAAREHLERTRPLAHEVRRRLEPAPPAHAARREQADPLLAEVPAGALGRIPRLRVVGEHADERTAASLVESGEEERQQRLRDPRVARAAPRTRAGARPARTSGRAVQAPVCRFGSDGP